MTVGRVRIVVATTEGPSTVLRITAEDPALRSVVCLGRSTTTLPISGAYDAFVRAPTGVVERAVGHPVFRVDVSAPIDEGESWQLGLYLAHRLKATGRLAEDDGPADLVLWVTGAVDGDLAVRPVERMAEKRRRSEALFAETAAPLLAVVPAGQEKALGTTPSSIEVLAAGSVRDVLQRLGIEGPVAPPPRPRWLFPAIAAGALASLAAVAWLVPSGPDVPAISPPLPGPAAAVPPADFDPAAVRLEVLERRPIEGAGCEADERIEPVDPGSQTSPGVCGIAAQATNGGAGTGHIWLIAVAEGTFREYAGGARSVDVAVGPIAPGETAEVRVAAPSWVRRPVVFRILLVLSGQERIDVSNALAGIDAMSTDEIDRVTGHLVDLGLDVRTARHRIVPRGLRTAE